MGFDVSDVKTVRWTVFTSGVTQSKEYGAGGATHATDDYATGTGTKVKVTEIEVRRYKRNVLSVRKTGIYTKYSNSFSSIKARLFAVISFNSIIIQPAFQKLIQFFIQRIFHFFKHLVTRSVRFIIHNFNRCPPNRTGEPVRTIFQNIVFTTWE